MEKTNRIQPHNEIWYISSNGRPVRPDREAFNSRILSNDYDSELEKWVIKFEEDITFLGEWSFGYCANLKEIFLPESLTNIKWCSFYYCRSLEQIDIPKSVVTLGRRLFVGCSSLKHYSGKFASTDGSALIYNGAMVAFAYGNLCEEYHIPEKVTSIVNWTFSYCSSLRRIVFKGDKHSLKSVGGWAFEGCSALEGFLFGNNERLERELIIDGVLSYVAPYGLKEYTTPSKVFSIGKRAFSECAELEKVHILPQVNSIGEFAFYGAEKLSEVIVGEGVTKIGANAFDQCPSLKKVTMLGSVPPIAAFDPHSKCWDAFDRDNGNLSIEVPIGSERDYSCAPGWNTLSRFK